ncbi:MAG: ParA family protein [Jiangellaceae bacterium]
MADFATVLTVSVLSLKGGVGKTSVALGLTGAAAVRGLRTLVVDLDPQGNATTALDPHDARFTASDVLADARAGVVAEALAESAWGPAVSVVASEPALEHRNHPTDGRAGEHRLRSAMIGLAGVDLVVVDCPPSLGELSKNALAASDLALVVTEPTMFALTGAQQALAAVDVVRRGFNLRLRPAGIVVNRFRTRSAEHRFRLDELLAAYRDLVLDPVLPERSAIGAAQGSCLPVQAWPSPGAREVARIFSSYLALLLSAARSEGPLTMGVRRR